MKFTLVVDGSEHVLDEKDGTYTSESLGSYFSILKQKESKYTILFDTYGLSNRSFVTLVDAFREALLVRKNYK